MEHHAMDQQKTFAITVFVIVLFLTGVAFGAMWVNALSTTQKQEIVHLLQPYWQMYATGKPLPDHTVEVWTLVWSHLKWIGLIALLGISVVGAPIICLLDFLKGMFVGFTVGFLVAQWSWQGMVVALIAVLPQHLFLLPAVLLCSVSALSLSMRLLRRRWVLGKRALWTTWAWQQLGYVACAMMAVAVEVYASPHLIRWANMVVSGIGSYAKH